VLVGLLLNGPVNIRQRIGDLDRKQRLVPGEFWLVPPGAMFSMSVEEEIETLHIYIREDALDAVASDLGERQGELRLVPSFSAVDPVIEQLGRAAYEAIFDRSEGAALYVDHLARALAAHLLRNYSNRTSTTSMLQAPQIGLNQMQFRRVTSLIEENLAQHLTLADLAKEAGLSSGHFVRLFKISAGMTPYQYIVWRRIERAKRLLAETNISITRVAIICGFADQEHLTRAFTKRVRITPAVFRKHSPNLAVSPETRRLLHDVDRVAEEMWA